MSLQASGTIAQFLTFSKRLSGQQVRWQKKQNDVVTSERETQRAKFLSSSFASRFWQLGNAICGSVVCGNDVDDVNLSAKSLPLSGYNLSIKQIIDYF